MRKSRPRIEDVRSVHAHGWDPLGVTPDGRGGANVALWADGAEAVDLCVFPDDGSEHRIRLSERLFSVFYDHVPDLPVGSRYGFRVHGPWNPAAGQRWNASKLLLDPYARAIDGHLTLHESIFGHVGTDDLARNDLDSAAYVPRSVVVAPDDFDWGADTQPRTPWGETVIYEAHVRGLTMRHPRIPARLRGTYAGIAHPAIIDHLHSLGVTAIELMPVHHFVDEVHLLELGLTDYWGYNSIGYFAPHAAYSASGSRGQQVREFKQMVKDLHAAGLEVILDVVYNHTAEGSELGPTLSFRGIDNDDYYRLREGGRAYADYTGCGNTLDVSRPHVLQLVMDSLRAWVTEMHVDGFRFDLASALARSFHDVDMLGNFMTTIQQDPVLRRVKLIAEPWDVGPGGYQVGEFPPLWTEWNGKYRDCIRDFWRGHGGIGEVGWRLTGSADLYASEGRRPYASINFITAHDGFTMQDLVAYEHKHNEANLEGNRDGTDDNRSANYGCEGPTDDPAINALRERQVRNLMTTLLLSTGVPMIAAGDELGKSQGGNNNAYCQDNEISWLDWSLDERRSALLGFVRDVARIRREHAAFRQRYFFDGRPMHDGGPKDLAWIDADGHELPDEAWGDPARHTLGMYIAGSTPSGAGARTSGHASGDSFLVVLHAGGWEQSFVLPGRPYALAYRRVIDTVTGQAQESGADEASGSAIALAPFSMVVLRALR
ncbi:MAG: glycogen debranching protein GlgX [Actinomycetales bacterium]|nr:glycogen debranching protein GlgX [Actinomycetales bacterium]